MNIIQNGDFQEGLHFWEIEEGQIYIVNEQTQQSIMIDGQGTISQTIPILAQTDYTFSFHMETQETEHFEIKLTEKKDNLSLTDRTHVYTHQNNECYSLTTHPTTQFLQMTIINHSPHPIFLHAMVLEPTNPSPEPKQESTLSSDHILYFENFKPGLSMWEHVIINQNLGQGEFQTKAIGHVNHLSLQPHTQYILSMDIKLLESTSVPAMITMGIFDSAHPHTLREQIDIVETKTDWFPIQLAYRTDTTNRSFNRIFLESSVPLAFTNISIQVVPKVFHENFKQPSYIWNNIQIQETDGKQAGYIASNGQVHTSLQSLSFLEKEQYVATASIKHPSSTSSTATCYIEYKNILNGVLIRKPVSIPSYSQEWQKIEVPFLVPEAPWIVSTLGFTYQGSQCLWFTEVIIEPQMLQTQHPEKDQMSFITKPKQQTTTSISSTNLLTNLVRESEPEIANETIHIVSSPAQEIQEQQPIVTNDSLPIKQTFSFDSPWIDRHQTQLIHYKNFIQNHQEQDKIESYLNQKYKTQLALHTNRKLIDLSHLQHFDAILLSYRMDHCLQQLTPACYEIDQMRPSQAEQDISLFFTSIRHMLQNMNPIGALTLQEVDPSNAPVFYQNNQIVLQTYSSTHLQNKTLLQHVYTTYCSSFAFPFENIDPFFHNVLYGLGLKWYEEMKTNILSHPSILSDIYQAESMLLQDFFTVPFDNEETYYATLFQFMYSPFFFYIAKALEQQMEKITYPNSTITNGMECIRTCMKDISTL